MNEGNGEVVNYLKRKGILLHSDTFEHRYPFGKDFGFTSDWRTKTPVITLSTKQWFLDLTELKAKALDALNSIQFYPAHGKRTKLIQERSFFLIISLIERSGVFLDSVYGVYQFLFCMTKMELLPHHSMI